VGEPPGREADEIVQAMTEARKARTSLEADLSKADMSRPAVRADFVERYLAQGNIEAARKLVDGFDQADPSPEHFRAFDAFAQALLASGKAFEVGPLVDRAEKVWTSDDEKKALRDLRAGLLVAALDKAYQAKDKALCLKILDEICDRYPDYHDMGKHRADLEKQLQESLGP
jgi:hypothetical protein